MGPKEIDVAKELRLHQPPPAIPHVASSLLRHERPLTAMYCKALCFPACLYSYKQCLNNLKTEVATMDRRCALLGRAKMRKKSQRE